MENVEKMAKEAAHLQLAIHLLTPALLTFVTKKFWFWSFEEKSGFSQIIRFILDKWWSFFPIDDDVKRKIFERAIKIRNAVAHQALGECCYDEDLLCLVQIAEFIGERKLSDKILASKITFPAENMMSGSRPNVQASVSRPFSNLNVHAAEFQQRKREPGPKANVPVNRPINYANVQIPIADDARFQTRPREPPSDKKKTSCNMGNCKLNLRQLVYMYMFE